MRKNTGEGKRGVSPRAAAALGLLFVVSLCFLRVKVEHTRTGYEISRNRAAVKELVRENQTLESGLFRLKSPEALEDAAGKMGFRFATYKDVVFVEEVILAGKGE